MTLSTLPITIGRVYMAARELASEHGENPEYDRALVELTMRLSGGTEDDRAEVSGYVLGDQKPDA